MADETIGGKAIGAIFWNALAHAVRMHASREDVPAHALHSLGKLPTFDALTHEEKGAIFDACRTLLARATAPRGGPRVRRRMIVSVNGLHVASPVLEHDLDFGSARASLQFEVFLADDPVKEPREARAAPAEGCDHNPFAVCDDCVDEAKEPR